MSDLNDQKWMKTALKLAEEAQALGEVPVGALVVQTKDLKTGENLVEPVLISKAFNNRESAQNPVGHAELLAISEASKKLNRWRLTGCTLYVTLEPCVMCAGAIVLSRIDRVVFGAHDPKAGAIESIYKIFFDKKLNHTPKVTSGVCSEEAGALLKNFFLKKR